MRYFNEFGKDVTRKIEVKLKRLEELEQCCKHEEVVEKPEIIEKPKETKKKKKRVVKPIVK